MWWQTQKNVTFKIQSNTHKQWDKDTQTVDCTVYKPDFHCDSFLAVWCKPKQIHSTYEHRLLVSCQCKYLHTETSEIVGWDLHWFFAAEITSWVAVWRSHRSERKQVILFSILAALRRVSKVIFISPFSAIWLNLRWNRRWQGSERWHL